MCDLIVGQAAKGDPFFQRHLAEGHLDGYLRDLVFIQSLRARSRRRWTLAGNTGDA